MPDQNPIPNPGVGPIPPSPLPPSLEAITATPNNVKVTNTSTAQTSADGGGTLNTETVTIESTPGGVRVKLPTLVLAHILSLAGVCGGTYTLARPDQDQTKSEVVKIRTELSQLQQAHMSMVERLARIETNTENIRDDIRERRRANGGGNGYGAQNKER